MEFSLDVWQVVSAAVVALAALLQFWLQRPSRIMAEIRDLESAMASARQRDDPLEHAYRARAAQRLQALHNEPAQAGFMAISWGGMSVLMVFVVADARPPSVLASLSILTIMLVAFSLFFRALGKFLYGTRTLEGEARGALEIQLVAARQKLIEAMEDVPPDARPIDVRERARQAWKNMEVRKRRDLLVAAGIVAVCLVAYLISAQSVEAGALHMDDATAFVGWGINIAVASPMLGRYLIRPLAIDLESAWQRRFVAIAGPIAWLAGAFILMGSNTVVWVQWLLDNMGFVGVRDRLLFLAFLLAYFAAGAWLFQSKRRASAPASPQVEQTAEHATDS